MSLNIYHKDTDSLEMISGRVADAYTKADIDKKLGEQIDSGFLQSKNLLDRSVLALYQWQGDGTSNPTTNRIANGTIIKQGIKVESGKTYTLSANGLDYCTAIILSENGNVVKSYASSWNALPFTFEGADGYLHFSARRSDNANLSLSTDYKIQLEKGNVATDYVEGNGKSNRELTEEVSNIKKNNTENASAISCTITSNKVIRNNNTVLVELEIKTSATSQINLVSIPYTLPVTQATLMITNSDGTFYSVGYATANGHIHSMKILNGNSTYVISGSIIAK